MYNNRIKIREIKKRLKIREIISKGNIKMENAEKIIEISDQELDDVAGGRGAGGTYSKIRMNTNRNSQNRGKSSFLNRIFALFGVKGDRGRNRNNN